MPKRSHGPEAFDRHFQGIYGKRWRRLERSMRRPTRHVALLNPFVPQVRARPELRGARPPESLPGCLLHPDGFPSPDTLEAPLYPYYLLDGASVFAARALQVAPGMKALDLCAAPGGKSVAIAAALSSPDAPRGALTSNELDPERFGLLERVSRHYFPPAFGHVLTQQDATRWTGDQGFDRVLADVPCSSERHLLTHSGQVLRHWNPARTREMAGLQYAIVSRALDLTRPGGRLVYSTCSISPVENDQVIARLLERRGQDVELVPTGLVWGEPTRHGWQILPDVTDFGPMYVAALRRKGVTP